MDLEKLKPHLNELIQFYYQDLENFSGGYLHVALDDGNLDENTLWFCQSEAQKNGDTFGFFLGSLLRNFKEEELLLKYSTDFWGMEKE